MRRCGRRWLEETDGKSNPNSRTAANARTPQADRVVPGGCNICFNCCSTKFHFRGDELVQDHRQRRRPAAARQGVPEVAAHAAALPQPAPAAVPAKARRRARRRQRFERISWEQALDEICEAAQDDQRLARQRGARAVHRHAHRDARLPRLHAPVRAALGHAEPRGHRPVLRQRQERRLRADPGAHRLGQQLHARGHRLGANVPLPGRQPGRDAPGVLRHGQRLAAEERREDGGGRPAPDGHGVARPTAGSRSAPAPTWRSRWRSCQHILANDLQDKAFCARLAARLRAHGATSSSRAATRPSGPSRSRESRRTRSGAWREEIAAADGCVIFASRGVNQHTNGTQTNRALMFLAAITGNWGRRGGAFFNMSHGTPIAPNAPQERRPKISPPARAPQPDRLDRGDDRAASPTRSRRSSPATTRSSQWPGQDGGAGGLLARSSCWCTSSCSPTRPRPTPTTCCPRPPGSRRARSGAATTTGASSGSTR